MLTWFPSSIAESPELPLVALSEMTEVRVTKQALVDTLASKWWILLLTSAIATGFLFAQDSRLNVEPARVDTTRRLEAREEISSLVSLEIDAQAFAPILSIGGEIARFNSEAANQERNAANGFDVELLVSQVPGDFNVVNREVTERNTIYSYVSVGSGIFTLTCTEASEKDCSRALDVGVAEFEKRRSAAIQASITAVANTLDARLTAVRELISVSSSDAALLAQRQLEAELFSQVSVLRSAAKDAAFSFKLIDERMEPKSATVTSVNASTYLLGLILWLIIGGLIILQFAVLRSRRS